MTKRNSIEQSRYINERYKEYLKSSFSFGNEDLQRTFEASLEKEDLFKGPYLDMSLPFKRGKSIRQLVDEGMVSPLFMSLGSIDFDRPLYAHQERALRQVRNGRGAVVTTGTGSGKTEAFLFPVINDILRDIEQGQNDVGIRSLFLYPMNALVNDQIARIRSILRDYPEITFGFFTGETPEKMSDKGRKDYEASEGMTIPPNELCSREEIRKRPPHLLFTNYSMLEFLLIRPNDYAIFTTERLRNWKYVVLDEAHSYNGTKGIEISYLMRRLTGLTESKPAFILTSATLGEQGKSERDIAEFASKLTSTHFEEADIIFSERIPFTQPTTSIVLDGDEYIQMNEDHGSIEECAGRYGVSSKGLDVPAVLYELLRCDKNVYDLYSLLVGNAREVRAIASHFSNLSEEQFVALVDLINFANKNGVELFSLKFHSFVRPLAGAYVSLAGEPELSLTKTNHIHGNKAFELGNCRFCESPFLIGRIVHNASDDLDHLYQNTEVDIYENYGKTAHAGVDYFLLEKDAKKVDTENYVLEKYLVCSKCGVIHGAENLRARRCECDESFEVPVYLVVRNVDSASKNNLTKCPCCGRGSQSGVVKNLNLGKDETTAIMAQTLLESMGGAKSKAPVKKKALSLKSGKAKSIIANEAPERTKQFLAFSDSRSQASFFALFLNNNHSRILRKRLIWEVIKNNEYGTLRASEVVGKLESLIRKGNLFDNGLDENKNAWVSLLVELMLMDGQNSCESLGLFHFELDLESIENEFSDSDVEEAFGDCGVHTVDELVTLMQVVFDVFKTTPAIDYDDASLSKQEREEYLRYRRFSNSIELRSQAKRDGVKSFLPIDGGENRVVRYVKKIFKCDDARAYEALGILFDLGVDGEIFSQDSERGTYKIKANKYLLKSYKNTPYYRCSKCGRITPYNLAGVCPTDRCEGSLVAVDPDEEMKSNYYRQQYQNREIERMIVEEHTAQLDHEKAKEYQQKFKDKKINVLSCSTTFEMGVDIGDLETVFMRNVPPSPANYVQRAGRAGRRLDSAAYILTYCGTSSHDYTYFVEPEKMISGIIKPPYFDTVNRKIVVRHLMAACLGAFFRENPGYFESVGNLVFDGGIEAFKKYLQSKPKDLIAYIDKKVIPEQEFSDFHGLRWLEIDGYEDEKLTNYVETCLRLEKEYSEAAADASEHEDYVNAKYFKSQLDSMKKEKVINDLSKYCVIPKYGFPVDVVELEVYEDGKRQRGKYNLNRDLRIGISEYAPGSEVIVDKKKYASSYITLPRKSELRRYYYCHCPKCDKTNVLISDLSAGKCKYCGEALSSEALDFFIEPIFGFKTGEPKQTGRLKPERTYSGEVQYLGGGVNDERKLELNGVLTVETSSNDELLVMNKSLFYYCPECGYSEKDETHRKLPTISKKHVNYRGYSCHRSDLESTWLGHRFQTDVARLTIPLLSVQEDDAFAKAASFMYAFMEGACEALEIDRANLNGLLETNLEQGSFDIVLYDDVPGGAGLVKRLLSEKAVAATLLCALAKVSQHCCDEETSCYGCLRNYSNQSLHGKLRRKYAKETVAELLAQLGVSEF